MPAGFLHVRCDVSRVQCGSALRDACMYVCGPAGAVVGHSQVAGTRRDLLSGRTEETGLQEHDRRHVSRIRTYHGEQFYCHYCVIYRPTVLPSVLQRYNRKDARIVGVFFCKTILCSLDSQIVCSAV